MGVIVVLLACVSSSDALAALNPAPTPTYVTDGQVKSIVSESPMTVAAWA